MEGFFEFVKSTPPQAWFVVALCAAIAYRFIPPDKRIPIFIGMTIKRKEDATPTASARVFMMIVVSLAVLVAALYIILSKTYEDSAQKWAYGSVGMILGHWLKK